MDLDAGPGPLGQRVGELLADLARPVDVGLEGDRPLGGADRLEHRGKDLVAVDQSAVTRLPGQDRRAEQRAHGAGELRVADGVEVLDLVLDPLLAGREIGDQQDEQSAGQEREENPHGDATFLPASALQPLEGRDPGEGRTVFSCDYNGWADVPEEEREGLDAFEASRGRPSATPALLPAPTLLLLPNGIPDRKAA